MATHIFLFSQGQWTQQQPVSEEIKIPYYLLLPKGSRTRLLWPLSDPPAPPKISLNNLRVWQWMITVWTILCQPNCFTTFETQLIPFLLEFPRKLNVTVNTATHSYAQNKRIFLLSHLLSFAYFSFNSAPPLLFFLCVCLSSASF